SMMARPAQEVHTYSQGFENLPPEISGTVTSENVAFTGFSALGAFDSYFDKIFARNSTTGNPVGALTLTLSNLPAHNQLGLDFLLAIIDSWEGSSGSGGPDFFNIELDGHLIFSHTFGTTLAKPGDYLPAPNVLVSQYTNLGFDVNSPDAAFYMGAEPSLQRIAHTAS